MFIYIVAAIVTLTGAVGFVLSSLIHASAAADFIFNAAAFCLLAGPLVFFSYVVIGMCMEFARINRKPVVMIVAPAPSFVVPAVLPRHALFNESLPEGLRRAPKGPMNPSTGRAYTL